MFHEFFYLLREYGMDVSTKEWLTLQEALSMGLHGSTMTGFYQVCRSILCKSETEYDKFEHAFQDFFEDVLYQANGAPREELPADFLDNVEIPIPENVRNWSRQTVELRGLPKRKQRESVHEGISEGYVYEGEHHIGATEETDLDPEMIQLYRKPMERNALRMPNWDFRDFREDNVLSIRQFQMAFRKLCLYSDQFGQEEELDIDRTIHDTCRKGGILQIRYKKPRKNTIRVLLLIDSGGTMTPYHALCSRLFQAVSRSNRLKDLKIYYFHNCLDEYLYTNPTLRLEYEISTKKVLRECEGDWRVLIVGDGTMDVNELLYPPRETTPNNMGYTGQDWLELLLSRYRHTVWLAPVLRKKGSVMGTWGQAYDIITDLFDMYPLSVAGLEQAMKKLVSNT